MDNIKANCNSDIIEQFANKKFNEGIVAERQRILQLVMKSGICNLSIEGPCLDVDCNKCWIDYLSNGATITPPNSVSTNQLVNELQLREGVKVIVVKANELYKIVGPAKFLMLTPGKEIVFTD